MNSILYYSNYCNHCKELIYKLSKLEKKDDMHFICIDKREKQENGQMNIILSNGLKIILPPNIIEVPSLLLLNRGNRLIVGNDHIKDYVMPKKNILENSSLFHLYFVNYIFIKNIFKN